MPSAEEAAVAEKSSTSPDGTATTPTTNGKIQVEEANVLVGATGEEEAEADEDPTTRQIRVALEALRARRAELREANAEIDLLQEQLLKAQADADTEREGKEFIRAERDLLEKARAAYAADLDVLKNQLGAARTTIEEEGVISKKLQTELGEERRARSALKSDIERLQSQLGSLSDGLKKLQGRFAASTAELEATKKEKAALVLRIEEADRKHAAATEMEASLTAARTELEEQQALSRSLQQELEDRRKAADSSAVAMSSLQAQLGDAREEQGRGREARLRLLGDLRSELEAKMQGAFHEICQELDQAPHRMLCTGPSSLRPRRPCRKADAQQPSVAGPRIAFPSGESLAGTVSVTSFRDLKSDLWFEDPEANLECDRCDARISKTCGRLVKMPGLPEQAQQEFICLECARADAVENKRKEEMRAIDNKRNEELKSFFPKSSPTREASEKLLGNASVQRGPPSSESSEFSESSSSPPHSSDSPPHSESPPKRRSLQTNGHRKRRRG